MASSPNSNKPGLIYSVVSKNNLTLSEYAAKRGNYTDVTSRMIQNIAMAARSAAPDQQIRKSFVHQQYVFHYLVERGVIFLTMADADFGYRLPFLFLEDVSGKFFGTYQDVPAENFSPRQFESFGRVLRDQMEFFTFKPQEADKLARTRQEVENVKQIVTQNIDKVLERGEAIEVLVSQTEDLQNNARSFQKKSTKVKNKMCRRNFKWTIISTVCCVCSLVTILLVLALLVYMHVFGLRD
eukprot:TRINITY_DN5703_c0_g1_i1.p1 TRINITY_DN5703_c0_g1~~TRINITY_DN5703_c0_g1_i1.p1  ORF type:complete len:240 (-),score=90.91 TRINITY_DN5703_c0_g1_i1:111-830(-)